MKIYPLERAWQSARLFPTDSTSRHINVYKVHGVELIGDFLYPNAVIYSHQEKMAFNPINERVMSLGDKGERDWEPVFQPLFEPPESLKTPVFFFLYNTDNYYHFVYDSLPYLISYFEMKERYPDLKLLVTQPNHSSKKLYPFVSEFLELAGVPKADIIFARHDVLYETMILSDSYTHGRDSNLQPRPEVYDFLSGLTSFVKPVEDFGQKIYISRRSWIHGDKSNMGTDYTTRRKMQNEDELVDFLTSVGYNEVFAELLSTEEKLGVFKQASHVVGAIGGGMCNVLFCPPETKVHCIISPNFLDINARFIFSFSENTKYWVDTQHVETGYFKRYMRVKFGNGQVGEIENISNGKALIKYATQSVAGWNASAEYKTIELPLDDLTKIDNGLNSEWKFNMTHFKRRIK